MTQTINDNIITARLFVEQISLDGDVLVPTGKVVEVDFFNSLIWSTSADFKKSGTVSFENALEKLTSSLKHSDSLYKATEVSYDATTEDYAYRVQKNFQDRQVYFNPDIDRFKIAQSGSQFGSEFLLQEDYLFGCNSLDSYVSTAENLPVCFVPFQRVWILSTSLTTTDVDYDGSDKKRTNVWSGIVSGLSDNFSEGGCTVSMSLSGLSRFLELTDIFQNYRLSGYMKTDIEQYLTLLKDNLYSLFAGTEMLTTLAPFSYMLLPAFLANYYFTSQGNKIQYLRSVQSRDTAFFCQEPLWFLNTDSDSCWMDIKNGNGKVALGKVAPYSSETTFNTTIQSMLSGEEVYVWQLIPSVYVDPLIDEIFSSDPLKVMQRVLQQNFELIDTSSISAKDLLVKVAQAIMGSAYEDDFGNLVLEISKIWSCPDINGSFISDPAYTKSLYSPLLKDPDHNFDYIISDASYFGHNKSFNEANLVTHVEVPTGYFQNVDPGEVVTARYLTGRTSVEGPENQDVLRLQRRYGLRVLTASPVTISQYNLGMDSYEAYQKALDSFAKCLFQLRNYASEALTLETEFLHHLSVNKNVLWLHDEALWLIKDKTITYTLGEKSASFSCSFVLSFRHKIYERAPYPFLDLFIATED